MHYGQKAQILRKCRTHIDAWEYGCTVRGGGRPDNEDVDLSTQPASPCSQIFAPKHGSCWFPGLPADAPTHLPPGVDDRQRGGKECEEGTINGGGAKIQATQKGKQKEKD